jgi:membrane-bound metal-dependent hydrolase YbcI (DUF457 family)
MYVFGHLGIGLKLVQPWNKGLSRRYILLGAILPDLIDKPLYYGLSFATGRQGQALGLISGTRTFGHAAITTLALASVASLRRSRALAAVTLGMAAHLLLDNLSDRFVLGPDKFSLQSLLWPLDGWRFPVYPFTSVGEQLHRVTEPYYLWAEALGLTLLAWEVWKTRNRAGIVTFLNGRRLRKSKAAR